MILTTPLPHTLAVFDPGNPFSWIGVGGWGAALLTVVFIFVKGYAVSGQMYQMRIEELRKKDEVIAQKDDRIDQLHDLLEHKALEGMYKASSVLEEVVQLLKERRIRDELERSIETRRQSNG